ncbi:MAG: Calx-beta domain-containing protein, partial [Algiphilus sp.]|uniref:Calx-beta domain-containing protein n=1 Tax=Algiphilus sp. TaxID=1872431 RepID=UPI0032ED811F
GTITVVTLDDDVFEGEETVTVALTSTSQGTLGTSSSGTGTITDTSDAPVVTIGDATIAEGGSLSFTVSLTKASSTDITIPYTTSDGTATGGDYTDNDATLTITAGQTSGTITV